MSLVDNAELSSIPNCLKQLQNLLDEAKYSEASKLCHKCLKQWPGENTFYRVKVFCEIQLSRWHSCLQTIGWLHGYRTHPAVSDKPRKRRASGKRNSKSELIDVDLSVKGQEALEKIRDAAKLHKNNENCLWFHFEQSYCYYKLGKYNLGLQSLSMCMENLQPSDLLKSHMHNNFPVDSHQFPDIKSNLLKAQLCMRLGYFKEASEIYSSLKLKGAESLLSVNKLSVDLSLASDSPDHEKQQLLNKINKKIDDHMDKGNSDDPYELYFNFACSCVLSNDVLKAQDYLDIANEMLENEIKQEEADVDPDEQVEFANILAFRVFLNAKRGNHELAKCINSNILENFVNSNEVDQATVLVSLNNQLFFGCNADDVANLVHKIEALLKKEQISRKFSSSELNLIHGNCVWAYLSTGNLKECQRYLQNFNRVLNPEDLFFFKSALMCVDGKISKGVSLLRQGLSVSKKPKFVECLAKLLLREGKYKEALGLLQEYYNVFVEDRDYIKKYFLLLVRVHMYLNSPESVYSVLKQLITFKQVSANDEPFKLGCKYLETQKRHEEALDLFKQLYDISNEDRLAQLGILYNQSFSNQTQIQLPRDYVDSVVRDVRFIDAEELEAEYKVTFHFEDQKRDLKTKVKKRRNKKRKNKKAQNPTGNPDPERWLHKYERASFKKQAKRRKDATKGLTQGSTSTVSSKPTTGSITATSNSIKR